MFVLFVVLTVISAIALIVGVIWWLATSGKTTRRSGPDVGAEIMGGSTSDDDEVSMTLLEKSAFVGKGVAIEREAGISYAEVKQMLRDREWRAAIPPLLALLGLYFFVVFGALALWFGLHDKLIATLIAGVVLFTMGRITYDFIRA
jgi:hypothetical protein